MTLIKKQPYTRLLNFSDLALGHNPYCHGKNTELAVFPATF